MSARVRIARVETLLADGMPYVLAGVARDALPALVRLARAIDDYASALAAGADLDRQVALWADVESARAAFDFSAVEP